jgi:hypothetical protein
LLVSSIAKTIVRKLRKDLLPTTALAVVLLSAVTLDRHVSTDGAYDRLYGFPFGWAPNGFYASMALDIYLLELFADLIFNLVVAFAAIQFVRKISEWQRQPRLGWRIVCIILITVIIACQYLLHFEGHIQLMNPIQYRIISQNLHVGLYP